MSNSTDLEKKTAKFGITSKNWTHGDDMYVEEAILQEAKAKHDQRSRTDENDDLRDRIEKIQNQVDKIEKMEKQMEKIEKMEKQGDKIEKMEMQMKETVDKILHAVTAARPVEAEAAGAAVGLLPGPRGGRP